MRKLACVGLALLALKVGMTPTRASSHREAPLISQDPLADNTDVYAFVSPERSDYVVLISNFIPLQFPSSGPNFWKFDDNVLYEIMVDNTGDAVEDITYQFPLHHTGPQHEHLPLQHGSSHHHRRHGSQRAADRHRDARDRPAPHRDEHRARVGPCR